MITSASLELQQQLFYSSSSLLPAKVRSHFEHFTFSAPIFSSLFFPHPKHCSSCQDSSLSNPSTYLSGEMKQKLRSPRSPATPAGPRPVGRSLVEDEASVATLGSSTNSLPLLGMFRPRSIGGHFGTSCWSQRGSADPESSWRSCWTGGAKATLARKLRSSTSSSSATSNLTKRVHLRPKEREKIRAKQYDEGGGEG